MMSNTTTTAAAAAAKSSPSSSLTSIKEKTTPSSSSAAATTKHSNHTSSADVTRRMVCGGLSGMIAKTATNPLERIKMLSQTGEHNSSSSSSIGSAKHHHRAPGMVALYRDIIRHEGVWGLWAGNGANLLRVFPAKAIVFSSNDIYKAFLFNLFIPSDQYTSAGSNSGGGSSNNNISLSGPLSFFAGGLAGMSACFLTYPLDLCRGRISGKLAGPTPTPLVSASISGGGGVSVAGVTFASASTTTTAAKSTKIYTGIIQTMVLTVKDEGFMALYKGVTPTLLGAMPYEGIKFGTVGVLEWYFPKNADNDSSSSLLHHPHYPLRKMLFGGMGGVMAGLITYPNDTVRRMMQLQGSRSSRVAAAAVPTFTGYWDCVRYIYRHYGIARFYRGCAVNIIRMAPNTAIQFGSYELLKKWTDNIFD